MANVSEVITLGVGTPSSIGYLIRFGLGQSIPIPPDTSILIGAEMPRMYSPQRTGITRYGDGSPRLYGRSAGTLRLYE